MVKNVHASAYISELSPQEVFQLVFSQAEAARRYHKECDNDPAAEVGAWVDGQREVVFRTRVNAPAAITRVLGIEALTIREVSRVKAGGDGAVIVKSTPILDFPGGSKFTTSSELRLSPELGGCQMAVDISCEAAGPWGLVGTIEETMATQAQATIEGFLAFCQRWCAMQQAASVPSPFAMVAALQNGISTPDSLASDDEFYDASPATPMSVASSSAAAGRSSRALAVEVQALSHRVKALEAAVQQLKVAELAPPQQQQQRRAGSLWTASPAALAAAAAVGAAAAVLTIQLIRRHHAAQQQQQLSSY